MSVGRAFEELSRGSLREALVYYQASVTVAGSRRTSGGAMSAFLRTVPAFLVAVTLAAAPAALRADHDGT
jgi:hypothetical protein